MRMPLKISPPDCLLSEEFRSQQTISHSIYQLDTICGSAKVRLQDGMWFPKGFVSLDVRKIKLSEWIDWSLISVVLVI